MSAPGVPAVVCNALSLRPGGSGVQTYIREMLRALEPHLGSRLTAVVQADAVDGLPPAVTPRVAPVAAGARRALAGLRSVGPADVVHGLDVDLPLRPGAPTVTTVHDLSMYDVPGAHPRSAAIGKRLLLRHAVHRADVVIAVSSFTAERLRARFGRDSVVVLEAAPSDLAPAEPAEIERVRRTYDLPDTFVLHVGTVEPRKDVPGLAAACERIGAELVLAGLHDPRVTLPGRARFLGYVPRGDLAALFGAATVVAYPSLYEGFGLPPVEAIACGAAVVATRAASLPEVLGDGAVLVAPRRVEALATALRDVLADTDRRAELVAAGRRRLADLSWSRAAEETMAVYRSL